MKILYYDCFAGISGDMHMGAMLDAGLPEAHLRAELSKLGLDGEFELNIFKTVKNGISATKADVILKNPPDFHRHLADIKKIIDDSALSPSVKEKSVKIFTHLAEAEAKAHGVGIEEVHFHEVGATDAIIDIAAAAIALDYFSPDKILSSPVQLGGGFVECAHGTMPVPAPATANLLENIPTRLGLTDKEMTTPTGAAILKAVVDEFTASPSFTMAKPAYGAGGRDLSVPNVLRIYMAEDEERESLIMIETNIDDMSPELYPFIEERLFMAGALDVYKTPVIMKKGRPAVLLSVLTDVSRQENIAALLFAETSSIGLRIYPVSRRTMQREIISVNTVYGDIPVKIASYGSIRKYKAEYEACRKLALEKYTPISAIYKAVDEALQAQAKFT